MGVLQTYKPISVALQARNEGGTRDLFEAAQSTCGSNDSFDVEFDEALGQLTLSSASEDELDGICSRLKHQVGRGFVIGQLQVNYRCILPEARKHRLNHKFISSAGNGFVEFLILFEPGNLRGDVSLSVEMLEYPLKKDFELAILRGLDELSGVGGYPLFDYRATLLSMNYEVRDKDPKHFTAAARQALLNAYDRNELIMVEPMLSVCISAPHMQIEVIKADILSRRGHIEHIYAKETQLNLEGFVPMSNMFGYDNSLQAMTDGKGTFIQKFSHFARVPAPPEPGPGSEPYSAALRMSG